jgi:serine/threonine protein kinase
VLLARDALTGDQVAIKRVFVAEPALGLPPSLAREIGALQRVRHHPNVVRLIDAFAVVSET